MSKGAAVANRIVGPPFLQLLNTKVTGQEHIPRRGGLLLAANHRSFLDHFLLAAASPRPLRFLGKSELSRGVGGRINLFFGMVPVDRGAGDLAALDGVVELLREGAAVAIFPEGTRSPTGELFRFRSGLPRIAASAQVPVVPVGVVGTAEVWPRGSRPQLRRPDEGTLAVHFGPILPPPDPAPQARRAFTERLHEAVAELCDQPAADRFAPIS